jgi:class 3 adenylate cyclase
MNDKVAITRLPHTDAELIGRETELARLHAAWHPTQRQHVFVIRGIGGEGKTSLVAEWAGQLAQRDYDGAYYFDWSFGSQGTRDQSGASFRPFVVAALAFFSGEAEAKPTDGTFHWREKAAKLLKFLRSHPTLLILDGLESLQHPPPLVGRLRDEGMADLLKGLAQKNPGLCVITTRQSVTDLVRFRQSTAPEMELGRLPDAAGAELLRCLFEPPGPGIHHVRSTPAERKEIVAAVQGHALTLRLLGGYIHKCLRDVRPWREIDYSHADAEFVTAQDDPEARYGHAFRTIEAYERWLAGGGGRGEQKLAVLRLLGLFDRPAVAISLAALRAEPAIPGLTESLVGLKDKEWRITLSELEECGLVSVSRTSSPGAGSREPPLAAHPLVKEYFARQLRSDRPEAWRAAHQRLYEHLCATMKGDALQLLYQAIAHGCHAGLHQKAWEEVYRDRILGSMTILGTHVVDLEAIACFFEPPWSRVSPKLKEPCQASLLHQAAFRLRALGRLNEALEPMGAALQIAIKLEDWKNASIGAGQQSELVLTLGDVTEAVTSAELAVTYAERSGDAFTRIVSRTIQANTLHQMGRLTEARLRFEQAEQLEKERMSNYPLLHSLQGYQYCELLLAAAERAAWGADDGTEGKKDSLTACREVSRRATQTFQWAKQRDSLLDIALNYLTLGRAALFEAILDHSVFPVSRTQLDLAVSDLRCAGDQQYLASGLLSRAWLRVRVGARTGPESAQADLDEVCEIAEHGSMPLFLADAHLYRARLFGRETPYPWDESTDGSVRGPKDDLADARHLIEKHGYGRRKEELADAEAASRDWPDAVRRAALTEEISPKPVGRPELGPIPPAPESPEASMPEIKGREIELLRDALVSAFDQDNFDQMLTFRLGKDRAALVGGGAFQMVVFELIKLAAREGWASDLIRVAREYVPGNPTLKRFCDAHPHLLSDKADSSQSGVVPFPVSQQWPQLVRVVNFEFTLNQDLQSFDEDRFIAALADLGLDISKIRIASIRPDSVIVTIDGEPDALERALSLLQADGIKFEVFARATNLVSACWNDSNGKQHHLVTLSNTSNRKAPAMTVMTKTVLELDLVGYSTIAATLEDGLGVEISPKLNQQIQGFVDRGLKAVGLPRPATVLQTTGDGAILVFDEPSLAHSFAEAVHDATRAHNAGKPEGIGKRVFRIGVATGEVAMEPKKDGFDIAGMAIARAVRMEAKAKPGEVLCDADTFAGLTAEQQKRYSGAEVIAGKRDEKFEARRCVLNLDGVRDAEHFTSPVAASPAATPSKPDPATQSKAVNRREILSLFKKLKPIQYDELIFLVEVPINRRPSETLDLTQRHNALIKWAEEEGELENLLGTLREVIDLGDPNRPW